MSKLPDPSFCDSDPQYHILSKTGEVYIFLSTLTIKAAKCFNDDTVPNWYLSSRVEKQVFDRLLFGQIQPDERNILLSIVSTIVHGLRMRLEYLKTPPEAKNPTNIQCEYEETARQLRRIQWRLEIGCHILVQELLGDCVTESDSGSDSTNCGYISYQPARQAKVNEALT